MIDRQDVIAAYRLLLRRAPETEDVVQNAMKGPSLQTLVLSLCNSDEYQERTRAQSERKEKRRVIERSAIGSHYAVPTDLERTKTPVVRVAFIGACFAESWLDVIKANSPGVSIEFYLLNNVAVLPHLDDTRAKSYDFHVVQVPLRSIIPENSYMKLSYTDLAAYEDLLAKAQLRLAQLLAAAMAWSRAHKVTTFVGNYMVPQRSAMGRLLPHYDLRNPAHMIAKLNEYLAALVVAYENAYLFDIEELSSLTGKRYIQDDSVWLTTHGGMLNDWDYPYDLDRLRPIGRVSELYDSHVSDFVLLLWAELQAMWRTLRSADHVKLVIFDLDDTLWRGVAAETGSSTIEGWPLGLLEALSFLKKRGVLLALVSKNDEKRIEEIWDSIFTGRWHLSDFAARKINWDDKATNIRRIIASVNVLPESVVFVDDNPVEAAAVSLELPEVRILGSEPLYLRRILLWASETQVPVVTAESSRRTEMVVSQIERDNAALTMPRGEFLKTLKLSAKIATLRGRDDPSFQRTFELINKTNQFNTTGQRWTVEESTAFLARGGQIQTVTVRDVYNDYGITGVCVTEDQAILQFVLSCRVFGFDIETAVLGEIVRYLFSQGGIERVIGMIVPNKSNAMSLDLFERCGFRPYGEHWCLTSAANLSPPLHIHLDTTLLEIRSRSTESKQS